MWVNKFLKFGTKRFKKRGKKKFKKKKKKNKKKTLESLRKRKRKKISIGHSIFTTNKFEFDSVKLDELNEIQEKLFFKKLKDLNL